MFIRQQGGLGLNIHTGKLHKEIWEPDLDSGRLDWTGGYSREPIGDFTFEAVKKVFWFGLTIPFQPNPYYPAWMYPTVDTVKSIMVLLSKEFPNLSFRFDIPTNDQKGRGAFVNGHATNSELGTSTEFAPGIVALLAMFHGPRLALRHLRAEFIGAGVL